MSPEAKAVFDASLADDSVALEFHKTYIDKNFTLPTPKRLTRSTNTMALSNVNYVNNLMGRLNQLALPSSVLSSLRALGASMAVDIADGPLPVGTILVAASSLAVATTIALNWDTVSPKFNQITKAFQATFKEAASNISTAFAKIKAEAKKEADKKEKIKKEKYDKAKKSGRATDNHSTERGSNLPRKGNPYSSKDLIGSKGVKQRRYYDKNGNADMDIDYHHGGNETHKFPHRHDWKNGIRGKAY